MALDVDQLFAAGVGMSALGWCSSCSLAKLTESSRGSWSVTYLFLKINAGASPANNRSSVPTSHELSSWLRRRHLEERRALGLRLGARLSAASGHSQAVDMRPNSTGILAAPGSGVACSFGSFFGGQLANGHDSGSSAVPCPQLFNEDVQELGGCVQVASGPGCSFAVASDGSLWRSGACYLWVSQELGQMAKDVGGAKVEDDDENGVDAAHDARLRFSRVLVPDDLQAQGPGKYMVARSIRSTPSVAVRSVSVGRSHCLIVSRDGRLFSFGNGGCGRLGVGDTHARHRPTRIFLAPDDNQGAMVYQLSSSSISSPLSSSSASAFVTMAAAGFSHSLALTAGGHVFSFGKNTQGQCGLGLHGANSLADKLWPFRVRIDSQSDGRTMFVGCGYQHSLVLQSDGSAHTFGDSSLGRCGHGLGTGASNVFQARRIQSVQVLSTTEIVDGEPPVTERKISPAFVAASCGYYHTMLVAALDGSSSSLYACGATKAGRLGLGPTVVTSPDEGVWEPTEVSLRHLAYGTEAAYGCPVGERKDKKNRATVDQPRVAGVSAGDMHTLLALEDGHVLACGYGSSGRLGNGDAYLAGAAMDLEAGTYAPGSEPQARYTSQETPLPVQGGLRVR